MTPAAAFDCARIGAGLATADLVAPLHELLTHTTRLVITAPPGTGKTTLMPPAVATFLPEGGKVVVTQPRRIAARAAARRLEQLHAASVGAEQARREIAVTVRGQSTLTPDTRIEFVTPGVLLQRLMRDDFLADTAAILIDEVHERSADGDLLLSLCRDLAEVREDLILIAMSATLQAEAYAELLGDATPAPILATEAILHPTELRYAPPPQGSLISLSLQEQADYLATVTLEALTAHPDHGAALVFVPGAREVAATCQAIEARARRGGHDLTVWPLAGHLSAEEQDAALYSGDTHHGQRVIVSTALAESSLTVGGVRIVIDSGLSRVPRWDAARQMSGLVTLSTTQSSATQRAGRASREAPGIVVRCYSQQTYTGMAPFPTPELHTSDLTQVALYLAAWGSPNPASLRWVDTPRTEPLAQGFAQLQARQLVDADRTITERGRAVVNLPVDPRIGAALMAAAEHNLTQAALWTCAVLSDDAPLRDGSLGDAVRSAVRSGSRSPVRRHAQRLARMLATRLEDRVPTEEEIGEVTALAFPESIARRQTDGSYLLARGTRATLPQGQGSEWLAVAEVDRGSGRAATGIIRAAAHCTEASALRAGQGLLDGTTSHVISTAGVTARTQRRLGAIVLSDQPVSPDPDAAWDALVDYLTTHGVGLSDSGHPVAQSLLNSDDASEQLRRRVALLHAVCGEPWPDLTAAALSASAAELMEPEWRRWLSGGPRPQLRDLVTRSLPWPQARELDSLVPEQWSIPSGRQATLHYPPVAQPEEPVTLSVKLQELFGLEQLPSLVQGAVQVRCELLSPAGRPVAVTTDLATFWQQGYPQVRKELRGRYPKHPWPEDPLTAVATAKTRRHLEQS